MKYYAVVYTGVHLFLIFNVSLAGKIYHFIISVTFILGDNKCCYNIIT